MFGAQTRVAADDEAFAGEGGAGDLGDRVRHQFTGPATRPASRLQGNQTLPTVIMDSLVAHMVAGVSEAIEARSAAPR